MKFTSTRLRWDNKKWVRVTVVYEMDGTDMVYVAFGFQSPKDNDSKSAGQVAAMRSWERGERVGIPIASLKWPHLYYIAVAEGLKKGIHWVEKWAKYGWAW